jgi:Lecithin retinol acyltransferase
MVRSLAALAFLSCVSCRACGWQNLPTDMQLCLLPELAYIKKLIRFRRYRIARAMEALDDSLRWLYKNTDKKEFVPKAAKQIDSLDALNELKPGDHIAVKNDQHYHYGIYLGDKEVAHFWSPGDKESAKFRKDKLRAFMGASTDIFVIPYENGMENDKSRRITVDVANTAVANWETVRCKYNVVNSNCDCFALWCKYGGDDSFWVSEESKHHLTILMQLIIGDLKSNDSYVGSGASSVANSIIGSLS